MSNDPFPDLNQMLEQLRREDEAMKKAGKKLVAEVIKKSDGSTVLMETQKNLSTGWDDEKPEESVAPTLNPGEYQVNPETEMGKLILQDIMKNEEKLKIDSIFSKLLKGEEKVQPLLPVPADPNKDMHWHTKDGRQMLVSQMETRHMFFALRKLFNESVPKDLRIDCDEHKVSVKVANNETKHAIKILFYQIGKRDNLTDEQLEKLAYMAKIVRTHL